MNRTAHTRRANASEWTPGVWGVILTGWIGGATFDLMLVPCGLCIQKLVR